ncbi:hypothetical protein B0I35DRAFT_110233 [Stachybotrys elegans]|uniref:Ankyrin repeat protein n=1 Tax=Stachybotrys elegans TaxID=80388 RepID=A0A8K0SGR3_9HYPO|nr:hypothetical protein B0I35DRAFT_110233 [Stachybotrys elegans]
MPTRRPSPRPAPAPSKAATPLGRASSTSRPRPGRLGSHESGISPLYPPSSQRSRSHDASRPSIPASSSRRPDAPGRRVSISPTRARGRTSERTGPIPIPSPLSPRLGPGNSPRLRPAGSRRDSYDSPHSVGGRYRRPSLTPGSPGSDNERRYSSGNMSPVGRLAAANRQYGRSPTPPRWSAGGASTPPRYKPSSQSNTPPSTSRPASGSRRHSGSGGRGKFFSSIATFAGIDALASQAGNIKDWIDWYGDISESSEEMKALATHVTTARDTVTQIQGTLEARPDLVEGKSGEKIKEQIEDAIADTNKSLKVMTDLLQELKQNDDDGHGGVMKNVENFWNSYRYKTNFEDKLKKVDADLQAQLGVLSTLMVNIYSRAIMKPAPPGSGTVPPPAPIQPVQPVQPAQPAQQPEPIPSAAVQSPPVSTQPVASPPPVAQSTSPPVQPPQVPISPPLAAPLADLSATMPVKITETHTDGSTSSVRPPGPPFHPGGRALDDDTGPPPSPSAVAMAEEGILPETTPKKTPSAGLSYPVEDHMPSPPIATGGTVPIPEAPSDHPVAPTAAVPPVEPVTAVPPEILSEEVKIDALIEATKEGDVKEVARALKYASPKSCDLRGFTPLHHAAQRDHLAVAMLLLDRGADVEAQANGGRTALHLAARKASVDMVEMLLERAKANPNAKTTDGKTPLHFAASSADNEDRERRDVLRALRDWGANPTVKNRNGETARDVAQARDYWDAASTLRRAEHKWEDEHHQNWLQRHGLMK